MIVKNIETLHLDVISHWFWYSLAEYCSLSIPVIDCIEIGAGPREIQRKMYVDDEGIINFNKA